MRTCPKTAYPCCRYANVLVFVAVLFYSTSPIFAASAPDWLKPYLTGEAATWQPRDAVSVLLERREVHYLTPDRCTVVVRGARRANTQEGTERLSARFSYNAENYKAISLRAWVVSPKGKVTAVPQTAFSDVSGSMSDAIWTNFRAFAYSAGALSEPGSVLAYEYSYEAPLVFSEQEWSANAITGLFRGEFDVFPAPNSKLIWHARDPSLPQPVPGAGAGSLTWRVDKVKPVRGAHPEGFYPTPIAISVRCVPDNTDVNTENWEHLSRWWREVFDSKCVVDSILQQVVAAEVTPTMARWDKIRTLGQFVQKKITYLSLMEEPDAFAGCRPHSSTEILARQLGDCKDKVTLMMALLRAAGEDAVPTLVSAGRPAAVDETWPSQPFNHVIVALRADADTPAGWPMIVGPDGVNYVLFDPTARSLPLGCLPLMDHGGLVLMLLPSHGGLARVTGNFSGVKASQVKTSVALLQDGSAQVSLVQESYGTDAGVIHQAIEQAGKDQATKQIERLIQDRATGARKLKWTEEWDALRTSSIVRITYEVPDAVRHVGKDQLLFTPPFAGGRWALQPWETTHQGTSWLPRVAFDEEIEITLPANVSPRDLPSKLQMETPGVAVTLEYAVRDGKLICLQHFQRPAGLYQRPEYEKMRQLVEKANTARRRPVMLSLAPASVTSAN